VTEGIGLTQSRGGDVTVLHPGDTLWCPPGEWHWHGAAPDRFMAHLAIWDGLADGQDGPETEWGELATDAEYGHSPASAPDETSPTSRRERRTARLRLTPDVAPEAVGC
jgi:gentisate 1,2-dioxygenase